MATASSLNRGTLSTLFVHAVEKYTKEVTDICRKEIKLLNLFKSFGIWQETDAPFAQIDPYIETKDVPVTSFTTGAETLPVNLVQGAHAKYVQFANLAAPVGMTWVEEQKIRGSYEMIDLAKARLYKAGVAIGERSERDAFYGTVNDANTFVGLEQIFPPKNSSSTYVNGTVAAFLAQPRWAMRQANNSYFGITRVPFTADDVAGTHLENVSVNAAKGATGVSSGAVQSISITSGVPSDGLQVINKVYDACTYGDDGPDVMVSSYLPFQQYAVTGMGMIRYMPEGANQIAGVNMGAGVIRFRNAWWYATEQATASGLNGDATTAGAEMIYGFCSKWHHFYVSRNGNLALTEWARAPYNLAAVAQLVLRCQQVNDNPRTGFCIFNWGA